MKSISSIMISAAALSGCTRALQSSFRIRTPQHLQSNFITNLESSIFPTVLPAVKEQPLEKTVTDLRGNNLSPFLQEMVDEQRELQMNVGKAMDVLKHDYPYFLKRSPGEYTRCNVHNISAE